MNRQQVKQWEQLLIQACDAHIAAGGEVIAGKFHGERWNEIESDWELNNERCPLACVGVEGFGLINLLTPKLGFSVSEQDAKDFVFSFDGSQHAIKGQFWRRWNGVSRMGRRLCKRYIKEKK